jgi:L-ascorbate peroxidase
MYMTLRPPARQYSGFGMNAPVMVITRQVPPESQAPVLLRLVFHDAGTFSASRGLGGANASVRFELKRPENSGLNRGWKVIEQTMQELRGTAAEGRVSLADLIALGGAYAVEVTGGPHIPVKIGECLCRLAHPPFHLK